MPLSSYGGCYLLHSYLTCSLQSEPYAPICFKATGEKSLEYLLLYKVVFKKNKVTDTPTPRTSF